MLRARVLAALLALSVLPACSVYMAASGEEKRDLGILAPGTTRDAILAEFGTPTATEKTEAEHYDIFRFVQGRSTGSNVGRAVFYGAAAVLTLGLSEVVTTPVEGAVGDQGEIRLRVDYGPDGRLTEARVLDGADWIPIETYEARVREAERAEPQPLTN